MPIQDQRTKKSKTLSLKKAKLEVNKETSSTFQAMVDAFLKETNDQKRYDQLTKLLLAIDNICKTSLEWIEGCSTAFSSLFQNGDLKADSGLRCLVNVLKKSDSEKHDDDPKKNKGPSTTEQNAKKNKNSSPSTNAPTSVKWTALYAAFQQKLYQLLRSHSGAVGKRALKTLMKFAEEESKSCGNFVDAEKNSLIAQVLKNLDIDQHQGVFDKFCDDYLSQYDDVRFFVMKGLEPLLPKAEISHKTALGLCSCIEDTQEWDLEKSEGPHFLLVPSCKEWTKKRNNKATSLKSYTDVWGLLWKAWLRVVAADSSEETSLDNSTLAHILNRMNTILLKLYNPRELADFLSGCYSRGGIHAILALQSIFTLITQHNLDYPNFYQQLYTVLDLRLFSFQEKNQFFPLFELFLTSKYLPSRMSMAFAKKLGRLALAVPAADCSICLILIYGILKNHKEARTLISRVPKNRKPTAILLIGKTGFEPDTESELDQVDGFDPYNFLAKDIALSKAEDSSLWEISQLSHHWIPPVASLTKIFEGDFDTQEVPHLSSFLQKNYESIFGEEMKKMPEQHIPLEYAPKTSLFQPSDNFEKYWNF